VVPAVIDAEGAPVAPGLLPAPLEMPPLIGLPPIVEVPVRLPPPPGSGPGGPGGPKGSPSAESAAGRERLPAGAGSKAAIPESFRVGYPDYLRSARMGEVAALALPGFAGLLALTAAGGLVGYRQAKAGHAVRAAGTARFLS
jgi:hypothetical protein